MHQVRLVNLFSKLQKTGTCSLQRLSMKSVALACSKHKKAGVNLASAASELEILGENGGVDTFSSITVNSGIFE